MIFVLERVVVEEEVVEEEVVEEEEEEEEGRGRGRIFFFHVSTEPLKLPKFKKFFLTFFDFSSRSR